MTENNASMSKAAEFCQDIKTQLGAYKWRMFQYYMKQLENTNAEDQQIYDASEAFTGIIKLFDGQYSFIHGFQFFLDNEKQRTTFEAALKSYESNISPHISKVQVNHMTIDIFFNTTALMVNQHGVKVCINETRMYDTPDHKWNEAGNQLTLEDNFAVCNGDDIVISNLLVLKDTNGMCIDINEYSVLKVQINAPKKSKLNCEDYVKSVLKTVGDAKFKTFQGLMATIKPIEVEANEACFTQIIEIFEGNTTLIEKFKQFLDAKQEDFFDKLASYLAFPPKIYKFTVAHNSITINFINSMPMNFRNADIKLFIRNQYTRYFIKEQNAKESKNQTIILHGFKIFKSDQVFLMNLGTLADIRGKIIQNAVPNVRQLQTSHINVINQTQINGKSNRDTGILNNDYAYSHATQQQLGNRNTGSVDGAQLQQPEAVNQGNPDIYKYNMFLIDAKRILGHQKYEIFKAAMKLRSNDSNVSNVEVLKKIVSIFAGQGELLKGFEKFLQPLQLICYKQLCDETFDKSRNESLNTGDNSINKNLSYNSARIDHGGKVNDNLLPFEMVWPEEVRTPSSAELKLIRKQQHSAKLLANNDSNATPSSNFEYLTLIQRTIGDEKYNLFLDQMKKIDLSVPGDMHADVRTNDAVYKSIVELFQGDFVLCNEFEKFMSHRKRDQDVFRQLRIGYNSNKLAHLYQQQMQQQTPYLAQAQRFQPGQNIPLINLQNNANIAKSPPSDIPVTTSNNSNIMNNTSKSDVRMISEMAGPYVVDANRMQSGIPTYTHNNHSSPYHEDNDINVNTDGTTTNNNNIKNKVKKINKHLKSNRVIESAESVKVLKEARESDILAPHTTFCKCHHKKCFNCRNCKRHCTCVAGFSMRDDFTIEQQKKILFKSYVNRKAKVNYEGEWYNATVIAFNPSNMMHSINYDDDNYTEIINLAELQKTKCLRWIKGSVYTNNNSTTVDRSKVKSSAAGKDKDVRNKKLETKANASYDMESMHVKIKHALIFMYKVKQYVDEEKYQIFLDHLSSYTNQIDLNTKKLVAFAEKNFIQSKSTEILDGFLHFLPVDTALKLRAKWTKKGLLSNRPKSKINGKVLYTPENKNNTTIAIKRSRGAGKKSVMGLNKRFSYQNGGVTDKDTFVDKKKRKRSKFPNVPKLQSNDQKLLSTWYYNPNEKFKSFDSDMQKYWENVPKFVDQDNHFGPMQFLNGNKTTVSTSNHLFVPDNNEAHGAIITSSLFQRAKKRRTSMNAFGPGFSQ